MYTEALEEQDTPNPAPSMDPMERLTEWARRDLAAAIETAPPIMTQLVSSINRYAGGDGTQWVPVSFGGGYYTAQDTGRAFDEVYLGEIQSLCRYLAMNNAFAGGLLENLESYIIGDGHRYRVVARSTPVATIGEGDSDSEASVTIADAPPETEPGEDNPLEDTIAKVQAFLDEWLYRRRWSKRQREMVRRKHRDGEVIIHFVEGKDGLLDLRFIEPAQLRQPATNQDASFGIETSKRDVEDVKAYWVAWNDEDPERISADEIQHRKANVDSNTKRGLPSLWAMATHLTTAADVLSRMGLTAKIQTSVAILKKNKSAPRSEVEKQVAAAASFSVDDPYTGASTPVQDFGVNGGAKIFSVSGDVDWEFPSDSVNVEAFVALVQAELRAAASRICMPEFMISADASNNNYSSALIAESPSIRMFEREQMDQRDDDLAIIWRFLEEAVESAILKDVELDQLDLLCEFPQLFVREGDKFSATMINERNEGVRSPQAVAAALGLDWAQEVRNSIDAELRENKMREKAGLDPMLRSNVLQPGGPNDATAFPGGGQDQGGRPNVPGNPAAPAKPSTRAPSSADSAPRPR